jgi:hypothetical protein
MLKKNSSKTRIICGRLRASWHWIRLCGMRYCLVQGSNPGVGRDFSQPFIPALGALPASCTVGVWCVPWIVWSGHGFDHELPHLAPRLRKSRSITHLFCVFMVCIYFQIERTVLPFQQENWYLLGKLERAIDVWPRSLCSRRKSLSVTRQVRRRKM